jgi:phosphatidylserine/phosphatidylglycerophosphate/cardiolipin synthase-like enzyme/peptidoglycan hydrolase-like protein with peptidoglycan-binding domain
VDPTLRRLIEAGDPEEELALLVRLRQPAAALPADARIVTRFGDVATVRVRRDAVEALWEAPETRSVKAPYPYRGELVSVEAEAVEPLDVDRRRPLGLEPSGRGVVVGVLDWGLDFRHPAFLRPDGGTRLLGMWDQAADPDPARPHRFGYGRIHDRASIDAALDGEDPVAALGYDPATWDAGGGTHGTATASVAAGSAWPGGVEGLAPHADIVFVNLAGAGGLGDSVAVAEAIDYVCEAAGGRPWVANMSLGRHGGPHDGSTLVEQLLDAAVREAPGRMIVNSAGNYFSSRVHTTARLSQGDVLRVPLTLDATSRGAHEIDVWYGGADRLLVGLEAPDGRSRALARPDADVTLRVDRRSVARIQHRSHDPNNGRNQALVRILDDAPRGTWQLVLVGAEVVDGRFHAWVEREPIGAGQARFEPDLAVAATTTGTICNGLRNLAVGAYNHHDPERPLADFSSGGPTVDGRSKPALLAPGRRVLAARSRPHGVSAEEAPLSARMSGTSLAAPFVTGTVACLMEVLGRVSAGRLRAALLESAERFDGGEADRAGSGYLDVLEAVAAVRAKGRGAARRGGRSEQLPESIQPAAPEEVVTNMSAAEAGAMPAVEAVAAQVGTIDPPTPPDPDEVLRDLAVSARELFDIYVLGRRETERERLAEKLQVVAGPGDLAEATRPGDLLVRGAMGEGLAFVSAFVTGELLDAGAAREEGLELEGSLPGRYAWVVDGGPHPHSREDRVARRVADRRGFLPSDQSLLRPLATAEATPSPATAPGPAAPAPPATEWEPEAVERNSREYIRWYQDALNRLDSAGLAVDGIVGPLTRAAVRRFQARKALAVDGIVGPNTERALMLDGASPPPGFSGPPPTPPPPTPPPPPPPPPPPSPPTPPPSPPIPGGSLSTLESRYFPPAGTPDAAPFSRLSTVEPIVDGRDYFAQMLAQINSLTAGDAWYLAGWWVDPEFRFVGGERLGDLLVARAAAGVDVRVIVWANRQALGALGSALAGAYRHVIVGNIQAAERLRARTVGGRRPLAGRVLIDWSGNAASSHHMKINVFSRAGALTAFAGGIDWVQNRLAEPGHRAGPPWHDAGARVSGDAAGRVLGTFVTRWREASTLSPATYDIGAGSTPFNPPPLAPFAPPALGPRPAASADTCVQVVRSFPDSKEFGLLSNTPWATLPRTGIHETKRTFQRMLEAAQRYIYVEDQAFNALDSLFPSLVAACRRGVKVIAVVPGQGDPLDAPGRIPAVLSPEVANGILAHLTPTQRLNLAVWQLDGIVVHSKLVLVDDELMAIGSANFMDRSMEFTMQGDDSECTVVAVSTSNLVPDLRVGLWAEHLRVSGPVVGAELRDLSKSLGFWRTGWGTGITVPHPDSRLVFVGPKSGAGPGPSPSPTSNGGSPGS